MSLACARFLQGFENSRAFPPAVLHGKSMGNFKIIKSYTDHSIEYFFPLGYAFIMDLYALSRDFESTNDGQTCAMQYSLVVHNSTLFDREAR